jgi:hypothetical protein
LLGFGLYEGLDRHAYVTRNFSEQGRGYVAPLMERHGGASAIRMTELLMRATLPTSTNPKAFRMATTSWGFRIGATD